MSTGTAHIEKKKKLSPKLRFKEFNGDWTNKKLNELIVKLDSGVSVNSIDEPVENSNQYGILKTSCISSGKFFPEENKKIIDEDLGRAKLNPVKDSILVSRMNTPQLVGHSGLVEKDYPNLFVPDRLWMTAINTTDANPKFLSVILSSEKTMGMISNIATGTSGSMKNISKPNFLNLEIHFPVLPEQQKIASFLSAVDEKIQQLTRKKELLEQYKKGVMQQLFSGKLRFKDDNGKPYSKWEEKLFKDVVVDFRLGGNYSNTETVTNYPLVKMGNLDRGKIKLDKIEYIPETETIDPKDEIKYGDLFFNTRNTLDLVGKVAIWRNELPKAYYNSNLMYLKFENNFFMNYRLNSYEGVKALKRFATGTTSVAAIYTKDLMNLKLNMPSLEEQQKIASFLTALDAKIENVAAQIAHTQSFKKGLLQQMFV